MEGEICVALQGIFWRPSLWNMCGVFGWECEGKTEGHGIRRAVRMLSELTSMTPQGSEPMFTKKMWESAWSNTEC